MSEAGCIVASGSDQIAAYVAGTLPEHERDQFEIHLLACAECRRLVREGAALRAALRQRGPAGARARIPWRRAAPAVLVAAAAALWVLWPADPLARLAAVRNPSRFAGMAVRETDDSLSARVDSALALFDAGRYDAAAARLRTAPGGAGTNYYLGLAELLAGRPRDAVAPLQAATLLPGPYAAAAQVALAKAWLRLGQTDSALIALTPPGGAAASPAATALADSIRSALPR